jgi:hypothetical protein
MSHISYELALLRREELLREAAERRLAHGEAAAREAAPSLELASCPGKLRRFARLRFAVGR